MKVLLGLVLICSLLFETILGEQEMMVETTNSDVKETSTAPGLISIRYKLKWEALWP